MFKFRSDSSEFIQVNYYQECVDNVVKRKYLLWTHQHQINRVGESRVLKSISSEHTSRVESLVNQSEISILLWKPIRSQYHLVNVGEQKREKDEEAKHGEDDTKEHLERSEKKLTPWDQTPDQSVVSIVLCQPIRSEYLPGSLIKISVFPPQ